MARARKSLDDYPFVLERLAAVGEEAPELREKLEMIASLAGTAPHLREALDRHLLERVEKLQAGLTKARVSMARLSGLLEGLTAPPWYPALYLGPVGEREQPSAMVYQGEARRIVGLADDVNPESLRPGDEVLLSHEMNVVLARMSEGLQTFGETAVFERRTKDGRLVLRARDEEIVVRPSAELEASPPRQGDLVRWSRRALMAFERLERSRGEGLFLEETPRESFADVGGLDRQIAALQRSIRLRREHASVARRYRLEGLGSVLLVGPPGTGKTMVARGLANWLAQISASGRSRFMNLKPSGLLSSWYGQTEANYREAFRVAREAGEREPEVPVVMFFDEVDGLGASRGNAGMRIDDRVLTAFMAELDGLEERGNILIVSATNRRDALDPALVRPGRLGDLVVEIPRPEMEAALDIFRKHLHPDVPYRNPDREDDRSAENSAARERMIEAVVSHLYAPNGDGRLATLTFRDGKRREIVARDLASGAFLASIARQAVETACLREAEGGPEGIALEDLLTAAEDELDKAVSVLTPANCRQHLDHLPWDVDVVSVERVERRVAQAHRFLEVA